MKDLFTCFSNFWSNILGSESSEVGFDRRLTVGSPSFDCRSTMLKLVSVLVLILTVGVGNAWGAPNSITYTFTSKSWAATSGGSAANWTSGKDGNGFSNNGIQVTSNADYNGANGTSPVEFSNVTKVVLTYNTNKSAGAGTIYVKVGSNDAKSASWAYGGSGDGRSANYTATIDYTTPESGYVQVTCSTTTNSIYLVSAQIFYGYTVTYDKNGGTGTMTDTNSPYASSATVTVKSNTFTAPAGRTFTGWNTAAGGGGTSYAAGATFSISAHTTLYAQWSSACSDPSAPGNSSISATGATITFSESGNYDIYYSTSSTAPTGSTAASTTVSSASSKALTGLVYGTKYYYWARKDCGGGSKSNYVAGSTPGYFTTLASNPTSISAGSTTPYGTTFTITDSNSPASYDIIYKTNSTTPAANADVTTTSTSKTKAITGLTPNTTYYYWVRGVGPDAKSSWVSGGSFTTPAITGISVNTAPTKTTYFAGETFDPTGLKITASYSSTSMVIPYAGNTALFSFSPTTATALTTSDDAVTITLAGQTVDQTINVYSVTVNKVNEDGDAIGAAGVSATWTVGTKALAAGVSTTNYVFKNWEFDGSNNGLSISSTSSASTTVTGTPTGNVTINAVFYKPVEISWTKGGNTYSTGTPTTEVARGTQWKDLTIPTAPGDASLGACADKFMGWTNGAHQIGPGHSAPGVLFTSVSGLTTEITEPIEFKAVFATGSGSPVTWTQTTSVAVDDVVVIAEIDNGTKELSGFNTTVTTNDNYGTNTDFSTNPAGTLLWTVEAGSSDGKFSFKNGTYYLKLGQDGNKLNCSTIKSDSTSWAISSSSDRAVITNAKWTSRKIMHNTNSSGRFAAYNKSHGEKEGGNNSYYYLPIFYKRTGGVTYSDYVTKCCTPLGYIGGSVEFTDPTTAVLTWNAMSNVDATTPYTITYRTGSDAFDDDNVGIISTNGAGKKTCTITGLSCNTSYDFKIEVTAASGYCDKDSTMSGKNSGTWNVTSTIVNGTKTDVPTTACGDYEAEFAASDGYHFPAKASITVTGASDFSWNSSTGVLSIDGEDITGNISISITCSPDACSDWGFYYGTDKVADWAYECFTKVKPADATDHEWQTDEIALPNKPNWYVDNATEDDGKKKTVTWDDLYFAASQGDGARPMVGTATGATGKIRIYDNWDWNNRAAGFLPTGYVLKFGSNEYAFDFVASNEYRTGIINLNSTTYADAVSVGIEDGNGDYVSTGNTQALRHIFFVPSAAWKTGSAKFCIHYWDGGSLNARSDYMSAVPGKSGWYEGWLPAAATGFQFERQNPAGDSPTEGNRWTAGENQTLQSNKNCYTMTASGGESDWDGTVTTSLYTSKGKFRMWDNSMSKNWYVTFYPHYVLQYDANSGSGAPADQSVALDASPCQLMVSSTAPTRSNYTFLGWNESSSATSPDGDWDGGDTHAMTGDVTLYAVWAANHTLTYNYNGGDGSSCSGGTKYTGESFTACSSAGSKTGYSFTGWKDGSGNDYTAGSSYTMPNSDLTLTAQWSVNSYKVTLTTNGGTINAGNVTSYTYGVGATLPTNVTRDGYRFDGWFTDDGVWSDQVTAISTTATGDKTYYAKWTAIYTVTWHVNGEEWTDGVVAGNSQVVSGEKISTMPDAPDNDLLINCANNFMGWSTQNAGTTPKTTSYYNDLFTTVSGSPEITGNTDFYAVYAELTPSITSWAAGSYYMIETYNNHYYALTGDVSSSAVTATDVTDAVTYNSDLGTITLNPSHSSVLPTMIYTLALSEGVYSITTSTSGCIKSGNSASLTSCSGTYVWNQLDKDDADATRRFGFVCSGQSRTILYNSSNGFKNYATSNRGSSGYGTGYFYLVPTTASNYVTQCASTQVRVNYVGNGGSAPSCSSGVTTKSDSYTLCSTEPTKSYYDFKGWNDGTNTYDAGDSYDLQDNTTFTAQWSATKYDITYELDGGTNHGDNPAKYTIEDEDIVLGEPTKDHYRFDGWYQTYSAGVFSNPITTISSGSHGNITVYAKWVAAYVITWDNPMGASVASTMVDQGSALGDLPVPSGSCTVGGVTYSNFVGWYTGTISGLGSAASDAGTQVTSATIPTGDVTYHAVYTNKPDYSSTQTSNVQLPAENPTNCVLMHIKVSSTAGAPTYQAVKMGTSSSKSDNSFTITVPIGTTSLVLHGVGWKDKTANVLISGADGVTITPSAKQQLTAHGNAQGTIDGNSVIVFATHDTETFDISGIDAAAKQTITITQVDERIIVWGINAVVPSGSTAKYITSCCSNIVTLNGGSPSNGTVSFSPSGTIGTCDDDVEVTMTITPASGYQLASFSVATGDGKVAPTSTIPAVVTNNNSSAAQNITLTFEEDSEGAYDVTASFSLMTVTSWTWTMHDGGGAIPDPLNLYVGQSARLDVAYTPSGVDASKKTYTRDKNNTYINWVGSLYSGYSTIEGRASTGDNTTAVTFTHADGPETVVNVKVLPLPLTHFEDLVHGKSFDDVVATLSDNALSATKTTPTSDDWTTPNANSCEENHLHLVGWIREDWPALVAYLAGTGDAPSTAAIVGAGNDGSGNAYFFTPNASINVQTFDGVTFYAVWAEIK